MNYTALALLTFVL